jgi:hypothetical protein
MQSFNGKSNKVTQSCLVAFVNLCYDRETSKALVGAEALDQIIPLARKHLENPSTLVTFLLLFRNASNNGTMIDDMT